MSVCVSVCQSVCLSQNFRAAWRLQKWFDLAEIWHTCPLGEYLGVFFFIFPKFWFLGPGDEFFITATIWPLNSWKDTEVEPSALRTFDYIWSVRFSFQWPLEANKTFEGTFSDFWDIAANKRVKTFKKCFLEKEIQINYPHSSFRFKS